MSMSSPLLICLSQLMLVLLNFTLQLISLCTTWWASFTARTDLGKPEEHGHYGLWSLCSTKAPRWVEDCDPLDTFFELPPYASVSLVITVIHLALLLLFLPLGLIRTIQVIKKKSNLALNTKVVCIAKVLLAFVSTVFAILVSIFVSIGESRPKEYLVQKGWSFWIQIFIILTDIAVTLFCVVEGIRFVTEHLQQQIDPEGKRAETYGNPTFDADSPEVRRHRHSSNGAVAYTESSGHPYDINPLSNENSHSAKDCRKDRKLEQKVEKNSPETLTYENECYQESSPRPERHRKQYQ